MANKNFHFSKFCIVVIDKTFGTFIDISFSINEKEIPYKTIMHRFLISSE